MNATLEKFIIAHCVRHPTAITSIAEFVRAYRQEYPTWTRTEIVAELIAGGFKVGTRNSSLHVAGIALQCEWSVVDGQLLQMV